MGGWVLFNRLDKPCRLSRAELLSYRTTLLTPAPAVCDLLRHLRLASYCTRRGCRAGRRTRDRPQHNVNKQRSADSVIPTICTVRPDKRQLMYQGKRDTRQRVLQPVMITNVKNVNVCAEFIPSLYVLNAAALTKPGAIEHLSADLRSYSSDVAVITETHFKAKHADSILAVDGYSAFRRDRPKRKGGGVAIYVRTVLQPVIWTYSHDDRTFELLWIKVGTVIVGALYHPPKSSYQSATLVDYLEACVEEIGREYPDELIVLAGDFNQLDDKLVCERTGLLSIVHLPTRGQNFLDRIYVSQTSYSTVRVVSSVVKSDHKAVIAYTENNECTLIKTSSKMVYRRRTPAQHALFLQHAAAIDFDSIKTHCDVQTQFNNFYDTALYLLDTFYPQRTVTLTSRDPSYITPIIKSMLRRKNRLMRKGRVEEATALALRIGKAITQATKHHLSNIGENADSRQLWSCVRQVTGKVPNKQWVEGISADSLNDYYCHISTDPVYTQPLPKQTSSHKTTGNDISEWQVFKALDSLRPTSTGLDSIPAWFLKTGAPLFCKPLAYLFNLSLATSLVPTQWKCAWIKPVPKVPAPSKHSDYRPISITPVLTRMMERIVVRQYIYTALLTPPPTLSFADQFAYRPTGSTTAAVINILHTVTHLLTTNPYVILIALDFSKAFDTVRHKTLLDKIAQLDIPDHVYNWLVHFFSGHSHQTCYAGSVSLVKTINASIVQGSAIGPTSYVVNGSDLCAINQGNELCKYADDTYLIVPASNADTRSTELSSITNWAKSNNLRLNLVKSHEIVFVDKRKKNAFVTPQPLAGLTRVSSIKILGVTITNGLSTADHVQNIITSSSQTLYALKVLRAHGLGDKSIQAVFRSVALARLLYASPAWWGFTAVKDRQKIDAFLRRSIRAGLCPPHLPTFEQHCIQADENLFHQVLYNPNHVLHPLLPPVSTVSQTYYLRPRAHDRALPDRLSHLVDSNFVIRMLYHDAY